MVSVWPSQSARDADADAWSRWPDAGVVESSVALVPLNGIVRRNATWKAGFSRCVEFSRQARLRWLTPPWRLGRTPRPAPRPHPKFRPTSPCRRPRCLTLGFRSSESRASTRNIPMSFGIRRTSTITKTCCGRAGSFRSSSRTSNAGWTGSSASRCQSPNRKRDRTGIGFFRGLTFRLSPGARTSPTRGAFSLYFRTAAYDVSDLGTVYALTGDEKYAKHARDILIGYSNCSRYGAPEGLDKRSINGLVGPLFGEALLLQFMTRGYDLISSSQSVSAEDRTRIHDELLRPLAAEMLYPGAPERELTSAAVDLSNRGAMGSAAVLLAGYATDDEELVNAALYGTRSTLRQSDPASVRKLFPPAQGLDGGAAEQSRLRPAGGVLCAAGNSRRHVGEGSPGYALYALGSLVNAAEAAWRHGLDLYSLQRRHTQASVRLPARFRLS